MSVSLWLFLCVRVRLTLLEGLNIPPTQTKACRMSLQKLNQTTAKGYDFKPGRGHRWSQAAGVSRRCQHRKRPRIRMHPQELCSPRLLIRHGILFNDTPSCGVYYVSLCAWMLHVKCIDKSGPRILLLDVYSCYIILLASVIGCGNMPFRVWNNQLRHCVCLSGVMLSELVPCVFIWYFGRLLASMECERI